MGSMSMTGPQNVELVKRLASIGSTKFRFSPDAVRPVLEKNRADIDWMERRLGAALHENLGEPLAGDVYDEMDLLRPEPAAVSMLMALLDEAAPRGVACVFGPALPSES